MLFLTEPSPQPLIPPPLFLKVIKGPKRSFLVTFNSTQKQEKSFENSFSLKISQHSASHSYIGLKVNALGLSPDQRWIFLKISEVDTILIRESTEKHNVIWVGLKLMWMLQLHRKWDQRHVPSCPMRNKSWEAVHLWIKLTGARRGIVLCLIDLGCIQLS